LLDCAEWGVSDPLSLSWLDPPPAGALGAARDELVELEALDGNGSITALGKQLRSLPLPPRLARMVIVAAGLGHAEEAAGIAAVMVERGLGGSDPDLGTRLEAFRRDRSHRASEMRKLAAGWARLARAGGPAREPSGDMPPARMLALAFPERIAKLRGAPGQFLLANGRGASLDPAHPLARSSLLAVAELSGSAASARILLAAAADEADILAAAGKSIREMDEIEFDQTAAALRSRHVRRLGAILLTNEPLPVTPGEETARLLAVGLAKLGMSRLPWTKAQIQLRNRVFFLRAAGGEEWPDLSDAALASTAADWLAPYLGAKTKLTDIGADGLGQALDALLPWHLKRRLEEEAPAHFEAPTGNRHAIDYEAAGAPALHIRVQELYGLTQHPAIAAGNVPLTLHLLSPAHRPIQITRDLPGFWKGSWAAVKAEMKGRYPRHPWPDDPASAAPTARAKPHGT
jgi:ATP-dependent helicase HrpB